MSGKVRARERDAGDAAPRCARCREPVAAEDPRVVCRACGAVRHDACASAGGCACGGGPVAGLPDPEPIDLQVGGAPSRPPWGDRPRGFQVHLRREERLPPPRDGAELARQVLGEVGALLRRNALALLLPVLPVLVSVGVLATSSRVWAELVTRTSGRGGVRTAALGEFARQDLFLLVGAYFFLPWLLGHVFARIEGPRELLGATLPARRFAYRLVERPGDAAVCEAASPWALRAAWAARLAALAGLVHVALTLLRAA